MRIDFGIWIWIWIWDVCTYVCIWIGRCGCGWGWGRGWGVCPIYFHDITLIDGFWLYMHIPLLIISHLYIPYGMGGEGEGMGSKGFV